MAKGNNIVITAGFVGLGLLLYSGARTGAVVTKTIDGLEFSFKRLQIPNFSVATTKLPIELSVLNTQNTTININRIVAKVYLMRNGKPFYLGYIQTKKGLNILPAQDSTFGLEVVVSNLNLFTVIPDFIKDKVTDSLQIKIEGFAHLGHLQVPITKLYNLKKKKVSGVGSLPADILTNASKAMPPAQATSLTLHEEGLTQDIINSIVEMYRKSHTQVNSLAAALKGKSDVETLRNVWRFVRTYIRYQIDPPKFQFIKTPARTWADKFGDCKALSIFIRSLLTALGIKSAFRFASYRTGDFTHVYVVAFPKNGKKQAYSLDACLPSFDVEKLPVKKMDVE